jgi:hypothetical protein
MYAGIGKMKGKKVEIKFHTSIRFCRFRVEVQAIKPGHCVLNQQVPVSEKK